MTARRYKGLALPLTALLLLAAPASTRAQSGATPAGARQAAVSYREFPNAGPLAAEGRDLSELRKPNGDFEVGIDINSEVKVTFDNGYLADSLIPFLPKVVGDERARSLLTRLDELTKAVKAIEDLTKAYRLEVELYEDALPKRSKADLERLDIATRGRATIAGEILDALMAAVSARLEQAPEVLAVAKDDQPDEVNELNKLDELNKLVDKAVDPIYDAPAGVPYNMVALGDLLNTEIHQAEADVAARLEELGADPSLLTIELRGHLVRQDGSATAVPLEGHNTVRRCAENRVKKIDLGLSAEEQTLLTQYEGLTQQIKSAQAEGKSLLNSVKTTFEQQKLPIFEAIETVKTAVGNVGDQLDALVSWTEPGKLEAWLRGPAKAQLETSQAVMQAWSGFRSILEATGSDFQTLQLISELGSIRQLRSAGAIVKIMDVLSQLRRDASVSHALDAQVWSLRLTEAKSLLDPVGDDLLAPLETIEGPLEDWTRTTSALQGLRTALEPIQSGAREALARLRGSIVAPVAAELPEPAGQERRPITANLDTEFILEDVCGHRDESDEVRLAYTFLLGDEELAEASWTDTFVLRYFGWHGTAKASLAFVNFTDSTDSDTWEPTTPVSYLLGRRSWPDAGNTGLDGRGRGSAFTFGFSTMPLDFSDAESVELGLAASVGLFDSFVVIGYGINLQADEEDFLFFSLRPFSLGGLFTPAGPKP